MMISQGPSRGKIRVIISCRVGAPAGHQRVSDSIGGVTAGLGGCCVCQSMERGSVFETRRETIFNKLNNGGSRKNKWKRERSLRKEQKRHPHRDMGRDVQEAR